MEAVLPRTYFGNIAYYTVYHRAHKVLFEPHEHFLKQSYRNRCTIMAANTLQDLIVPINRKQRRQPINTLEISYAEQWQRIHLGALVSAYKVSPFFDHYAHIFEAFYKNFRPKTLWELNTRAHEIVQEITGISTEEGQTKEFIKVYPEDYRNRCRPKDDFNLSFEHSSYLQVFEDRHGFRKNLSILDLIFNEGPNAVSFL